MRRFRRGRAERTDRHPPFALPIDAGEARDVIELLRQTRTRIAELSPGAVDPEILARAGGTALAASLYARLGLAVLRGSAVVPLLVDEIGEVEAAVLNLESYDGHEVVLSQGYALLHTLEARGSVARPVCLVDDILAFADETGEPASGAAAPSLT